MFIFIFLSILGFAGEEVPIIYTQEELAQQTNTLTLISESPAKCAIASTTNDCSRILIYESDAEVVHHLLVDQRSTEVGKFDVNKAIREPESFTGPITTYSLVNIFNTSGKILNVKANFKKETELELQLNTRDTEGNKVELTEVIQIQQLFKPAPAE